jgi:hypothetical protein
MSLAETLPHDTCAAIFLQAQNKFNTLISLIKPGRGASGRMAAPQAGACG